MKKITRVVANNGVGSKMKPGKPKSGDPYRPSAKNTTRTTRGSAGGKMAQ